MTSLQLLTAIVLPMMFNGGKRFVD